MVVILFTKETTLKTFTGTQRQQEAATGGVL